MGLPVEINPLFVSSTGGYQIGRSLRFRSSANAYLNRTPASASNRRTWTWSGWVKLGVLSSIRVIFGAGQNATTGIDFGFYSDNTFFYSINGVGTWNTTAVFRDPSAWYHVVFAFDSTQATQANRSIVYINNVNYSFTSNGVVLNNNYDVNNNIAQYFGQSGVSSQYLDGYLAEVNFIDGSALTSSSFGAYDANGVWQPAKYNGTYGTNGFYLPFSNTTSTTTLVQDASGNGNNWTANNISLTAGTTYDSMLDVPTSNSATAANFAVLNPLAKNSAVTLGSANLNYTDSNPTNAVQASTFWTSTGKWYWETTLIAAGGGNYGLGIVGPTYNQNTYGYNSGQDSYLYLSNGNYYEGSTSSAYGASYTTNDVIGIALDCGAGTITFYKNNVSQGTKTGTNLANKLVSAMITTSQNTASAFNAAINFGQRPFTYTPPTGFVALNTANLPAPSIKNGAQHFAATTYTGNGTSQSINNAVNGISFQPDFVWYKDRSVARDHALFNVTSGATYLMSSNNTSAESAVAGTLTSFNSNGYSIGSAANANANGETYIGWQWKGGGTAVTNNSGTITSSVSANASAGFSVVTYTGTGANATVGHGLGVAPSMIIIKNRQAANSWVVYHVSTGNGNVMLLNSTNASTADSTAWNTTTPTSSVFSLGTGAAADTNQTTGGGQHVAYCFAAVSGYSAFGSYTGNGSADGPFVYTGFRPRWIMVKRTDTIDNWEMWDSSRGLYNIDTPLLYANLSNAETAGSAARFDALSNGFKIRTTNTGVNASGGTYIYAAFAENPFNYSRAR